MGRIRKFTDEAYEALQEGVCSDEVWTEAVADFFGDIPLHVRNAFHDVELDDDMNNFKTYLTEVSDLNDYSARKIKDIFTAVQNVDKQYAVMIRTNQELLKDYTMLIKNLRESIGNPEFKEKFSSASFLTAISEDTKEVIKVRWQEILKKDAEDITDAEYLLLAEYLVQSGDGELLEDMLIQCYDYDMVYTGNNGAGLTTTVVVYESPEKIKMLAAAVFGVMDALVKRNSEEGVEGVEDDLLGKAIQMNEILQEIATYEKLNFVSQEGIFTVTDEPTRRQLTEELIEITRNIDGTWNVVFCPCETEAALKNNVVVYENEASNMINYIVSQVSTGDDGWRVVQGDSYRYINAYAGKGSILEEMGMTTYEQLMSTVIQEAFEVNAATAITYEVLKSGAEACDTTLRTSMDIGDIGPVVANFELTIVTTDTNGDCKQYGYSMYKSSRTDLIIDAFNQYMQSEEGYATARLIGYEDLPDKELTYEYICENPERVAEMIDEISTTVNGEAGFNVILDAYIEGAN